MSCGQGHCGAGEAGTPSRSYRNSHGWGIKGLCCLRDSLTLFQHYLNVGLGSFTECCQGFFFGVAAYSEACRSAFRLMSITIPIDADRGSERMPIKKPAFSER